MAQKNIIKNNRKTDAKSKDKTNVKSIDEKKEKTFENPKANELEQFDLDSYIVNINDKIKKLFKSSKYNNDILEDILLDCYIKKNENVIRGAKKLKQLQMNIGKIWQIVIGNYENFIDLGEGNKTGLDIRSDKLKIIIELKNRYNTDNASSKKSNYDKLTKFKKANPDYKCIYAVINDKTKIGKEEIVIHNGFEITYLSGNKLLTFIFGNNKDTIIKNLHKQLEHL